MGYQSYRASETYVLLGIKLITAASPSFWDRPVITKATEWNVSVSVVSTDHEIQMNPINDPKRKVLPDYRLLSMPCLTSVEIIVCREVPEGPLARSMRDTMVVDHFTARNPDGLMIGDIAKAFAIWYVLLLPR